MDKHIKFFFFFMLLSPSVMAQEEMEFMEVTTTNYPTEIPEKLVPVIAADFKLPTTLGNSAFNKITNGIADINAVFQYPIAGKWMIGAGFKYQYYQFSDFITNSSFSNSGKLFNYAPYGKLSYLKFSTPRLFTELSVNAGYAMMHFNSFTCSNTGEPAQKQFSFYIEPQMSINLFVDENLAFNVIFSDIIIFNNFNPDLLCLSAFNGLHPDDSKGNYNVLGVGFGFIYFLNPRK